MNSVVYNLSQTPEFNKLVFTCETNDSVLNLNKSECVSITGQRYKVIRYNKDTLCYDNIPTYGIYRSVIVNSNNQVVCFSPPKSVNADAFIKKYNEKTSSLTAEEFVEGTMINVFWDNKIGLSGSWEISTRNKVGALSSFYTSSKSKTFRDMFLEAAKECNLEIANLDCDGSKFFKVTYTNSPRILFRKS